jgi:hypothetical protein
MKQGDANHARLLEGVERFRKSQLPEPSGTIDFWRPLPTLWRGKGCHTSGYQGMFGPTLTKNRLGYPYEQPYVSTDGLPCGPTDD